VFEALAEGRVNLSGLVCLAAHLTPETAEELLVAASNKTRLEIERLIAERFPRADVAPSVEAIPSAPLALATAEGSPGTPDGTVILGPDDAQVAPICTAGRGQVSPLTPEAYAVRFTRSREADERFRYAQDLMGHGAKSGDIAEMYDQAMKELIKKLERVRFGACERPRSRPRRTKAGSRHIPTHVKRAVWQRDGGQCTFKSESGRRCEARRGLEFDHAREFARGGEASVDGIRLRCRGHNQYTAEQTFGAGFMQQKRELAAATRATKKRSARDNDAAHEPDESDDVYKALRTLGYQAGESRRALALCADMSGASSEARLRRALTYFPKRGRVEKFAEAPGVSASVPA
jgi:5-methylcytosine-specific restriction endonuclease McrA